MVSVRPPIFDVIGSVVILVGSDRSTIFVVLCNTSGTPLLHLLLGTPLGYATPLLVGHPRYDDDNTTTYDDGNTTTYDDTTTKPPTMTLRHYNTTMTLQPNHYDDTTLTLPPTTRDRGVRCTRTGVVQGQGCVLYKDRGCTRTGVYVVQGQGLYRDCLLYTSPSPRD